MQPLTDFLNHGILPFAGRTEELESILLFWHTALQEEALRPLLIIGEAGMGKSRLIQEVVARIEAERGAVVHIRLYPESTVAILPLAAQALWKSRSGQQLLRSEPEGTVASVTESLRRFSRLRPTLLIVEDIHLLHGTTLREFAQMLEAVEDEPLALLCTSRPVELLGRGVLERWPLEEILLGRMKVEEITMMWRALFGEDPSEESASAIAELTLGNPLAIRSALRGAVRQEAVVQGNDGRWMAEPNFKRVLSKSAGSLTEGMTAHLEQADREAASRLAVLGEVISHEAAAMMVDEVRLKSLVFSGILHELTLPKPPLPGLPKSADLPLAFTHSLVHRHFIEHAQSLAVDLIRAVAARVPLYSVVPFEHIRTALPQPESMESLPTETIEAAIAATLATALALDNTSDWEHALGICAAAVALVETNAGRWNDDTLRLLRSRNLAHEISLRRRAMYQQEFGERVEKLLELTADPQSDAMIGLRLVAFVTLARHRYLREGYDAGTAVRREVSDFLAQTPNATVHRQRVIVVQCFSQFAEEKGDDVLRREIEQEYNALYSDSAIDDSYRLLMKGLVAPHFLTLFATEQELAARTSLYEELSSIRSSRTPMAALVSRSMLPGETGFLRRTGRADELLALVEQHLAELKGEGTLTTYYHFRLLQLWVEWMIEANSDLLLNHLAELKELYSTLTETAAPPFTSDVLWIVETALIRGDTAVAGSIAQQYNLAITTFPDSWQSLLNGSFIDSHEAAAILETSILTPADLIPLRLALASTTDVTAYGTALIRGLDWLADRRLNEIMDSFLRDFGDRLGAKQLVAYRKRSAAIADERRAAQPGSAGDNRLSISMLGRVEVMPPGGEPLQPRGARQKSFLAAMVAAEMLTKPLERSEFLQAVGIEVDWDDPKLARDAVNSALYRLRDLVGSETIDNSGDVPRLDHTKVRVDLLEAHRYISEAEESMRRGLLGQAQTALLAALDITHGEVPFPALYENFFEAMREDFENRFRSVLIGTATRLLREADAAGAEELLERAFTITPDDEEIAELYQQALEALGKKAEAERVRWKVEVVD